MLSSSSKHAVKSLRVPRTQHAACFSDVVAGASSSLTSLPFSQRQQRRRDDGHAREHRKDNSRPDIRPPMTAASLTMDLVGHAATKNSFSAVKTLIRFKDRGFKPDALLYHAAADALASRSMWQECWALIDDMKGAGLVPDVTMFNHLIRSLGQCRPTESLKAFDAMESSGVQPGRETYELILLRYVGAKNMEMSIDWLFKMDKAGFSPGLDATQAFLRLAMDCGFVNLALGVARNFERGNKRQLDATYWAKLLAAAADHHYADGLPFLWDKVVNGLSIKPTLGLCVDVLNVAGRHGMADLAISVLQAVKSLGQAIEEHHIAPMVAAFMAHDRIKDAFAVLCLAGNPLAVSAATAQPIATRLQAEPTLVDTALSALEQLYEEGTRLTIACVNVLIQAAVTRGDLQRALGIYQVIGDLGLAPTAETFNFLLSGAILAQQRELGDTLMKDMQAARVRPDAQTYERFVVLCLGGDRYEDAFFYLEEMKGAGLTPPRSVYDAIIRRCVLSRDRRYEVAVEEMRDMGYEVDGALKKFLEQYGPGQVWSPNGNGESRMQASGGGEHGR